MDLNIAFVLWGTKYSAQQVVNLYHQIRANSTQNIRVHLYTESNRQVDPVIIHHPLPDLPPCEGWWHKTELFNPLHYAGPLLYLDLDVVVAGNIDWITRLDTDHLWGIRDYRKLWDPRWRGYNSSVMWWDTRKFGWLYQKFTHRDTETFHGDQDWITYHIKSSERRFFDDDAMLSWRWQCHDGGWNHSAGRYNRPGAGTDLHDASVIVFHGSPNPWEIECPRIRALREAK